MLRRIRRVPSPALVIASVALVVAVGGGTFAIAAGDNAKDKRIAKKVANRQIHKLAPKLSVKHARTASKAGKAASAALATNAGLINGTSVKQFAAKVQPGQAAVTLVDTGLVTLSGTCSASGQHGVTLTKDTAAPSEAIGTTAAATNSSTTFFNHGDANFTGTTSVDAGTGAGGSVGHVEVIATTAKVSTITFLGRDANNFSPAENVCVFSGTAASN